jgi:hypothetical protein
MSKQTESLTTSEQEPPTPAASWTSPYSSPETLTHMRKLEAREWRQRYRQKTVDVGAMQARAWWVETIDQIEKKRGKEAATELRYWMNQEK